jgi:hypothetical protein
MTLSRVVYEPLTLPDHMRSPPVDRRVRVAQSSVLCITTKIVISNPAHGKIEGFVLFDLQSCVSPLKL